MKKNLKLLVCTVMVCVAMVACEMYPMPDFRYIKHEGNGIIKSYNNSMVLMWNETVSKSIDTKMPPPAESRIYAMVMLAMHDALNNVVPKYETYALEFSGFDKKDVSKKTIYSFADAAVAQAAHDVLVAVYPASKVRADSVLTVSLDLIAASEFKDKGIQIGKDAAAAMLEKRQNDVLPVFQPYPQGTEPGQYRSTPPFNATGKAYAPYWGQTTPFGIISGDQFRPEPPYKINSPEYTADYNEVKVLGSNSSTVRTQEQTDMALFVTDNMPSMMNRVARAMAKSEDLNGWETARLFALLQMTQADALICNFDGAYYYNYWRPITAIKEGENDGNGDTQGEPDWSPLTKVKVTPALPSYPSGYSVSGRAGADLFKMFFGTDKKSFTIGSYLQPGVERTYDRFSLLATDMGISRIYGGHNFRNDHLAGEKMGKKVAKYVYENNLRGLY